MILVDFLATDYNPSSVVMLIQVSGSSTAFYRNCQKYVPIDLANLSKVIASEAISQVFQKIASSQASSQ
jgi:hypothetical protein